MGIRSKLDCLYKTCHNAVEIEPKGVPLRAKVSNVLSRCHTKRRIGVHDCAHPSFGMTLTFEKKKSKKKKKKKWKKNI